MSAPDIKALTVKFAQLVNAHLAAFRAEKANSNNKELKEVPELKVVVNSQGATKIRTPEEQAQQVLAGRSWTCSSSHMTDNARHVGLNKNGRYVKAASRELDDDEFKAFKEIWNSAMVACGLGNYKGELGYNESDAYHLKSGLIWPRPWRRWGPKSP
jgi:hypothetical protein